MKLGKIIFNLLQKLFLSSRKSNFRILHIHISWRYQVAKHKTRNKFSWITLEVNTLLMKFGEFAILKKKIFKYLFRNWNLKTSSSPFCVCKKLTTNSIGKPDLKQATSIRYMLAKLGEFVQISTLTSSNSFLQGIH